MKYLQIVASIVASVTAVHSVALAQGGPIQQCTFTATQCIPLQTPLGVYVVTEYLLPITATVTQSYDCQGCADVTVIPKACDGHGPVDITTTTVFEPEQTITTDVCSPTPN